MAKQTQTQAPALDAAAVIALLSALGVDLTGHIETPEVEVESPSRGRKPKQGGQKPKQNRFSHKAWERGSVTGTLPRVGDKAQYENASGEVSTWQCVNVDATHVYMVKQKQAK